MHGSFSKHIENINQNTYQKYLHSGVHSQLLYNYASLLTMVCYQHPHLVDMHNHT